MICKRTAVYPGTFDPITLGHLDIIKRSSSIFDNLVIAIAESNLKKTLFSLNERVEMVKKEVRMNDLCNVKVKSFNGLLVKFVKNEGINIIVRGLRAIGDFEHEFQMSFINKTLDHNIETIFLPATENVHFISSTFVKEVTKLGVQEHKLVSPHVKKLLIEKLENA